MRCLPAIDSRSLLALFLALSYAVNVSEAETLDVVTSISPLASIVSELGGEKVNVSPLIAGASDPHTFDLKPGDMKRLLAAKLLVFNGLGLEFWARGLSSDLRGKVFVMFDGPDGEQDEPEAAHEGHEHHHGAVDMHAWLDPLLVESRVEPLCQRMCQASPVNCPDFQARAGLFRQKLRELDAEIRTEVSSWQHNAFLAYHPAWSRFAKRYGLKQEGVMRHNDEVAPSIKGQVALLKKASEQHIGVLVVEPMTDVGRLASLMREGGLRPVTLDPLGQSGEAYAALMRRNLSSLAAAMKVSE